MGIVGCWKGEHFSFQNSGKHEIMDNKSLGIGIVIG